MDNRVRQPQRIGQIIKNFDPLRDKYISREFQKYGYDLANELDDLPHKALYIKFAKNYPRVILEKARCFVKDARARNKGRLFMWKLAQIRKEKSRVVYVARNKSMI